MARSGGDGAEASHSHRSRLQTEIEDAKSNVTFDLRPNRFSVDDGPETGVSRKALTRKLVKAKVEADKSAMVIQNRIQLLDKEDTKMQRKIEQTRRMAEKLAQAQELQEEKYQRQLKVDEKRDREKKENMIRVEEERKRAREALENANKKQIARML